MSDFEYEFQMALMNRRLDPDVETIFLTRGRAVVPFEPAREQIHVLGGDVSASSPRSSAGAGPEVLPNA